MQAHKDLCIIYGDKQAYYNRPEVWEEVQRNYLQLIEDFPHAGMYLLWFAEVAWQAERYQVAQQYFQLALRREPDNPVIQRRAKQFLEQ